METKEPRPTICTDEHLEYLDELRESGVTNMFGARPYLCRQFPTLTLDDATEILSFWMHDDRHK